MPRTAPQSPNATLAEQQAYFAEHGFVVLRGVIDQGLCGQISEHVMQNMQPLVGRRNLKLMWGTREHQ